MNTAAPTQDPGGEHGLAQAEAAQRLRADGPNELTPQKRRTAWRIAWEVAREPMFQLLVVAGLIYLVMGSVGEALMLLAFVALTITITVVQEQRTEHALEALRDLTSPHATVLRDGASVSIAGREVVCGDVIALTEGDRVAADARVLSANDLQADESLLTGESVPVAKAAAQADLVYAGSMIVGGQGLALVVATGARSEIGRIGKALESVAEEPTPLKARTRQLVRQFSIIGLGLSVAVVLIYGLARHDWIGGLLAGITLAMSMLPQEFLLIFTVFMAMGAWRMSREHVLARRAATIEALGSATVLCTDKTGTLTQNRMELAELAVPAAPAEGATSCALLTWTRDATDLPEAFHALVEFSILASESDPFDPMDKAVIALGTRFLPPARLHGDWTLAHEYGLTAQCLAMTHVWQPPGGAEQIVSVKGALESVARLCRLPTEGERQLADAAQAMGARGLRVLVVARATFSGADWPASPDGFAFTLIGLLGLADPLSDGVAKAVGECRAAGIRVVMITGDDAVTASAIATQAGLDTRCAALTGAELAAMDDAALERQVSSIHVFARVLPEQKLRIVQALKNTHQVVAMTGDGVNDAPSLKAAHIGIAMGGRGTDVAREAASLVLLDDNFSSIVSAIRHGRRIFDNLRKAMAFVFAVHVPIAGLSLLPLLLGMPLLFSPVHIAFLELLIDPACSIVFESEGDESDVMNRPPRDPAAPLFSRTLILGSMLQGVLVLIVVGAFFATMLGAAVAEAEARAAAFTCLVLCAIALIIANRAFSGRLVESLRRPNPALWRIALLTTSLLAAVLLIAPLRALFNFAPVSVELIAAALALAMAVLLVLEGMKLLRRDGQAG
jgi:Ca2+-transporting ATPase